MKAVVGGKPPLRVCSVISIAVALVISLTACSSSAQSGSPSTGLPAAVQSGPATVEVSLGDITPVITVEGEVLGPVDFQITSEFAGTVAIDAGGGVSIVDSAGTAHPISANPHVTYDALLRNGDSVTPGVSIAQATYSMFALVAVIDPADLVRLTSRPSQVRAQLHGRGAPFECDLLDPRPSSVAQGALEQKYFVACELPEDQSVINGLRGLVALQFDLRSEVPTLPIQAVAGTLDSGLVFIKKDGEMVEKKVKLGVTDGVSIEIVQGLKVGDVVYIPSPSIYK